MNEWSVWSVDTKQKQLYSLKLTSGKDNVLWSFILLHSQGLLPLHKNFLSGEHVSLYLHITSLSLFQFSASLRSFSLHSPSLHLFLFLSWVSFYLLTNSSFNKSLIWNQITFLKYLWTNFYKALFLMFNLKGVGKSLILCANYPLITIS